MDSPAFMNAKFDWWLLWLSGCDAVVLALGPAVVLADAEKIASLLDNPDDAPACDIDPGFTLIGDETAAVGVESVEGNGAQTPSSPSRA